MPRVLHIFCGPFPTHQGTQVLVDQTCRLSTELGFETVLLTYAHGQQNNNDVPFTVKRVADFPRFRSYKSGPAKEKFILDLSIVFKIKKEIKKFNPHVLHAHHYEALVAARLADPLKKRALIFHQHALFEPELYTYAPKYLASVLKTAGRSADRWLPRLADTIITVSRTNKKLMEKQTGQKIENLYPYASLDRDLSLKSENENREVIALYTGNLDKYQGIDNLITALKRLDIKNSKNFKVIINTGSDFKALQNTLSSELSDLVNFVPFKNYSHTFNLMQRSDFSIIPRSLYGGIPVKLINSLSAGLPVIGDNRLMDGLNFDHGVYSVNTDSPNEFASAIKRLIVDFKLRKKLSCNTLNGADIFSKSRALSKLSDIYTDILG